MRFLSESGLHTCEVCREKHTVVIQFITLTGEPVICELCFAKGLGIPNIAWQDRWKHEQKAVIMKFRKKPVVIEAVQAEAGNMALLPGVVRDHDREKWVIRTLEGVLEVSPGDWIITGIQGEKYPCKPDIFAQTYEPAE